MSKWSYSFIFSVAAALVSPLANAEMQSLSDNDLSDVSGQGIGLVLDDFVFSHGHAPSDGKTFRITGLTNEAGDAVTVNVNQLYIARSGSNYGAVLDGVNLGRLDNPYEIELLDGGTIGLDGEAVLQMKAPEKVDASVGYDCLDPAAIEGSGVCSSRPASADWVNGERPDIGVELEIAVGSLGPKNLNFHAQSAVFDGSYVRLWGDENVNKMAAEFRLNFYTPQLEISTCDQLNEACGSAIKMQGFELELALGNTFQPLYFGADSVDGGLTLEIAKITHPFIDSLTPAGASDGTANGDAAYAFFEDYYTNPEYRSNLSVSNLEISGTSLGSSRVEGVLIQYLDVKLRDLGP